MLMLSFKCQLFKRVIETKHRHENCWQHGQHASGTKQIKLRNQRYMAYLELEIIDNACMNYKKEHC